MNTTDEYHSTMATGGQRGLDVNIDQSAGIMVIDVMPSSSHGKMCWNPSMCSKGKGLEGFIT